MMVGVTYYCPVSHWLCLRSLSSASGVAFGSQGQGKPVTCFIDQLCSVGFLTHLSEVDTEGLP